MLQSLENQRFLLCRLGTSWCALGLQGLGEVMRPQPVDPIAGLPAFVEGLAVIRGLAVPVINLPLLLCGQNSVPGLLQRFVTADSDGSQVALRVDEVAGVQILDAAAWRAIPSLVEKVHGDHLAAVGNLHGDLLLLLRRTQLLTQEQLAVLRL